jgi:isoamylase
MEYSSSHSSNKTVSKGRYYPLGATLQNDGVNFALYSQHAAEVYLLLFDAPNGEPAVTIRMDNRTKYIWHCFVRGLTAGQLYGYKVCGEYNPRHGLRFNEHKLLLDPYAKAISHKFVNKDNLLLAYNSSSESKDLTPDLRDNYIIAPKSIVVDDHFDWQNDASPDVSLEKLFIYEVHVKGFTAHPSSGVKHPGTYLGFIEKIPYLQHLGINAVEFLPIHEFYVEDHLRLRGLTNYWGYNTIGFLAPELSYSTGSFPGCQVEEFKTLVRELHRAGIVVILDVVFNHSGEGNELGPCLSFKGIDNLTYFSLIGPPTEPLRYYANYSGCGNSLNVDNPPVLRLVMDSLRYWVEQMHVDGFRFDLASVLGREGKEMGFQKSSAFFEAVSQDPVLNRILLIAEPWDLGTYQSGNFPVDWSEWNSRYRDTVRKFIKGDAGQAADMGWRLTGSADLYSDSGRSAYNSINFVTCHDGFTLYDLVSYNQKHNEANGEENRDGTDYNNSYNWGAEGLAADNPGILLLREQLVKNFLCTLLCSSGTPMITGGDEFLRSQRGNNNAYCQDNDISWFNWHQVAANNHIVEFFRKLIALTRRYTILQRRKFYLGRDLDANNIPDLSWFPADGGNPNWGDPELRTLCLQLDGSEEESALGDYQLFIILHPDYHLQTVQLPELKDKKRWYRVLDTSRPVGEEIMAPGQEVQIDPNDFYLVNPRSTVMLLGKK